jgi:hypothetical protein
MNRLLFGFLIWCALVSSGYAQHGDVLPISDLTITGVTGREGIHFPYVTDSLEIVKYLGKPDSVTPSGYECGSEAESLYYYGGMAFDLDFPFGVYPSVINLVEQPQIKLKYKNIILSRKTTEQEFKKRFPKAAKKDGTGTWLRPSKGSDDKLRFFFDSKGYLSEIEYWIPC